MLESAILEVLRACYDPGNPFGTPANLIELGCVEALELIHDADAPGAGIEGVSPRFQLALTILPTSSDPDARTQLRAQVLNALAGIEQLSNTTLAFAEGWRRDRITPEGRSRLKLDAAPFAILNNRLPKRS